MQASLTENKSHNPTLISTARRPHFTKNFRRLDNILFQDKHSQTLLKSNNLDGFQLTKVFRAEAHLPNPTRTDTRANPILFFNSP